MKFMNAIACFSLFAITKTPALPLEQLTYSEAAQQLIPVSFSQMVPHLRSIDSKTLPHQVKKPLDLRKEVLKVRDYLDIFAYAMPDAKIKKKQTRTSASDRISTRGMRFWGPTKTFLICRGRRHSKPLMISRT